MRMRKYVMQTFQQLVIWGILLLITEEIFFVFNVRWWLSTLVELLYYFGLPFIMGAILCLIVNRVSLKFKNRHSKRDIQILGTRICIIALFLLLGRTMESLGARNWIDNYLAGKYTESIVILGSFNAYLMISLFPLAYGVTDFLFVKKQYNVSETETEN